MTEALALLVLLTMLVAIAIICGLTMSEKLDRIRCDWVRRLFLRLEWITTLPYKILFETFDGFQLGEHIITDHTPTSRPRGDRTTIFGVAQAHLQWTLNA